MGKSDPDGPTYRQQSMILVPADAPGVEVLRDLTMFGYQDRLGHGEVQFTDVRVPATNMLGAEGDGFAIAQGRLGPGRMHYAMRAIGFAERAMSMMCRRAVDREAFGGPLADQGVVREWIARSRVEIDQARLLTLNASWLMDTQGNAAARSEVAAIKVVAMEVAHNVVEPRRADLRRRRGQRGHRAGPALRDHPRAADRRRTRTRCTCARSATSSSRATGS